MLFSRRDRSKSNSAQLIAKASLETLESRRMLTASPDVWSGAGSNSNFTNGANWVGGIAPTSGQAVTFPSGVTNTTVTVDSGVTVGDIVFNSGYTLSSGTITLDGTIHAALGEVTFNDSVVLGESSVFQADDAALLTMNGVISDGGNSFGVDKQGNGELVLAGSGDTYTGQTAGDGGILIDTAPLASHIAIHSGTTFYGSNSITGIDGNDGGFSAATYNVSDNTTAPATMTVDGNIAFTSPSGATMTFDIGGTSASSKIEASHSGASIDLADTTFSGVIVNGYVPTAGDVITLLNNDTGSAITGTFLNLPQGSTVPIGGQNYTISYTGGTNHDNVILTATGSSATNPTISSHTVLTSTHGYTVDASVTASDTSSGGTAGLTYTWTAIHVPSGGKQPTYNVNGTNAAKNVVARFFKDGTYNLQCTVKDKSGHTATSITQVVVEQKFTSIKLEPHGATVAPKKTEQYVASALDQFAHPIRTAQTYIYSVPTGGGTVSSTGLFTAGSKAEKFDVEATDGSLSAIAAGTIS